MFLQSWGEARDQEGAGFRVGRPGAPTKIRVSTSFDVDPAEDRPPQARIDRGDPSDGPLAVISDQLPLFFNETCWKNPTGLHTRALEVEANLQKLLHDREAPLHQQINHHRDVVAHEDFAVVQLLNRH